MFLIFFNIGPKKSSLLGKQIKVDCSFFSSSLHLLFPKKNHYKYITKSFLRHGSLFFFLPNHLSCLSHCKTRSTMSLKTRRPWSMSFEDLELHGHSDILYLRVNRNGPGTSSTTNHIFYRALGRLHGPWCKQPLLESDRLIK